MKCKQCGATLDLTMSACPSCGKEVELGRLTGILGMVCPQMIYPYLRAIVSDVCTRAGFPPILLTEVNFQAMFEAQQAQAAAQGNGGSRIITSVN